MQRGACTCAAYLHATRRAHLTRKLEVLDVVVDLDVACIAAMQTEAIEHAGKILNNAVDCMQCCMHPWNTYFACKAHLRRQKKTKPCAKCALVVGADL